MFTAAASSFVHKQISLVFKEQMFTLSRVQVDRILKAKGNVTIETPQRAATFVGRKLRPELVWIGD